MKKFKYFLSIVAFMLIPFVLSSCSNWTVERYIYEFHRDLYDAENFLPRGFASYDKVKYDHKKKVLFFFVTDTMTVKVKYDDFYIAKKHETEEIYDFLDEPVESAGIFEGKGYYDIPVAEFEYNGFCMSVAAGGEYPKKFGIVGYNDETKEIAYLWFHDPDMDYIAEPGEDKEQAMIDFVDDNFKLK